MTNITTILFDMDGVLINAKEWHYGALNRALVDFGYAPITHDDHLEYFDGLPSYKKLQILQKIYAIPADQLPKINVLKQQYTAKIAEQLCHPLAQHIHALSRLKSEGYQIAVCSNSVRNSVITMMTKTELMPYLQFCLSSDDVTHPKPDPEIYLNAMKKFSAKPVQCLVLEDNYNGIKAAKAAGAHCMEIKQVEDVTYDAIIQFIEAIEADDT